MDMDEQAQKELAQRASPYGLALLPETQPYEYTDPQNETAVQRRWQRRCEKHGAAILGIRDVPTQPIWVQLDGIRWLLGPMGNEERGVPAEEFNRWRALEAEGIPFYYWLWGEEQPQRPNLRPLPERATSRLASGSAPLTRPRDPIVIGVIPTAPHRGLWVLIARWFH
jgi:hypothetical protein